MSNIIYDRFRILSILVCTSLLVLAIACRDSTYNNSHSGQEYPPYTKTLDTNIIIPPAWAFGIIYGAYTNQQQSMDLIDSIIMHDYPIDAFWIDSWIWDWKRRTV